MSGKKEKESGGKRPSSVEIVDDQDDEVEASLAEDTGGADEQQQEEQQADGSKYRNFDPTVVSYTETCLFIGPRNVGKTTACIILLRAMNLNRGFVQCGSPEWKKTWGKVVPMLYLQRGKAVNKAFYDHWMSQMGKVSIEIEKLVLQREKELEKQARIQLKRDTDALKKSYMDRVEQKKVSLDKAYEKFKKARDKLQKKRLSETQAEIYRKMSEYKNMLAEPESLFAVLDDLGNGTRRGTLWSTEMQELMNMGRHYLAAVMVIIQNMMDFPPGIRQGLDWIFVWPGAMGTTEIDKLMKHYIPCEIFAERKDFLRALRDITSGQGKHTCMVIHRTGSSTNARDRVFRWNPYMSALCKNGIPKGYLGHADFTHVGRRWYNGTEGYMFETEDPRHIRAMRAARSKKTAATTAGKNVSSASSSLSSSSSSSDAADIKLTAEEKQRKMAEWEEKWENEAKAVTEKGKRQGSRGAGSGGQAVGKDIWKKASLGNRAQPA